MTAFAPDAYLESAPRPTGRETMIRVLVVEDDPDLLDDLVFGLRQEGFEATGLREGAPVLGFVQERMIDVIVLDLGLPDVDGLNLAQSLTRSFPQLGIVMLTGRSAPRDRVLGLESGADIYLTKTAERRELVAAIRAVARRLGRQAEQSCRWTLFRDRMVLLSSSGISIDVTRQELQLLTVFSRTYGGEASRRQLIEGLGHNYMNFDERRLETLVSRLRRKITAATGIEGTIRAMRGEGYLFVEPLIEQ